jgi:hypothetical protein
MPTPTWPASAPQSPQGYSRSEVSNIEAFSPEKGPDITGPLFAKAGANVNFTFHMSLNQLILFRSWWTTATKGGAIPFFMLDPVTSAPLKYRMQKGQSKTENPLDTIQNWEVTLPLYEMP